jgi:hypothetical protein
MRSVTALRARSAGSPRPRSRPPRPRAAASSWAMASRSAQQLAAAPGPPGVEGRQLHRRRVGPVEVVEHDHQRGRGRGLEQGAADGVEALEPGPRGRSGLAALEVELDPEGAQGLQPGPERRGALPAGAPDDGRAPRLGVVGGRRGQGGLADPGLAGEGDEPAPGRQRGRDQRLQLGKRLVAADQTSGGRRHAPDDAMTPTPAQGLSRR